LWSQARTPTMTKKVKRMTPTMMPVFCWEVREGAGVGVGIAVAVVVAVTVEVEVKGR
jgi:hypothetical protein